MGRFLGALVAIALGAAPAVAGEIVQTDEGWYRVEDGNGEAPDSAIILVQVEDAPPRQRPPGMPPPPVGPPAPPPPPGEADPRRPMQPQEQQPAPEEPMTLAEEIAEFQRPDCEAVRGQYVQRVLELHGVDDFSHIPPEQLAVLGRVPPPMMGMGVLGFPTSSIGDPALAPLYGMIPVPPGALSYDFTLKNLARDLIRCMNMELRAFEMRHGGHGRAMPPGHPLPPGHPPTQGGTAR